MIKILLFVFLVLKELNSEIYKSQLKNYSLETRLNEKFSIDYLPFSQLYNLRLYPMKENNIEVANEFCVAQQRQIDEILINSYDLDSSCEGSNLDFTNIIRFKSYYYLINKKLEICSFQLKLEDQDLQLEKHKFIQVQKIKNYQIPLINFEYSKKRLMVFGDEEAYSMKEDLTDLQKIASFKPRKNEIFAVVSSSKGSVFVAAGINGLDFYQSDSISYLIHKETYDKSKLGFSNQNFRIQDVKILEEENLLYILDYYSGLRVFDFFFSEQDPKIGKLQFEIAIKNVYKFDIYSNNIIFLIGNMDNDESFVQEIIMFKKDNYHWNQKINRKLTDDNKFIDVKVSSDYAYIIAKDIQPIIFHTIPSDIVPDNNLVLDQLVEPNLSQIDFFSAIFRDQYIKKYFITLTKSKLKLYEVFENHANLECLSDSSYPIGNYQYKVEILAKQCLEKQKQNDQNPLNPCLLTHQIDVNLYSGINSNQKKRLALYIGLGLSFLLLIIFSVVLVLYLRYKNRLNGMQLELEQFKKSKYKYAQMQEGKENDDHEQSSNYNEVIHSNLNDLPSAKDKI